MTKPDGLAPDSNEHVSPAAWGTWEDLLLAFAVNRHGTHAWDSIATELQKRTSDPNLFHTAHNCRSKYVDLKRRFFLRNGGLKGEDDCDDKSNVDESAPLLEELRKLRVAELRREVQRYDLNIESLELKMKRLEEERERREKIEADLDNYAEEKRDCEPEASPAAGGEPAVGRELEKDQLSVNESNSIDPEAEKLRVGEAGSEPAKAGGEVRNGRTGHASDKPAQSKREPDHKSLREDSCNGSSNSIEEPDQKTKSEPGSTELEAESDGGAAAMKENSDVQSSACRSRKEEGSDKVRRGNTSGDEREHEDQSCAAKELPAESQPFVDFLNTIREPKLGSIFERRLRSQETLKYQKLILQHMDLETVEARLKEGWYTGSATKFYRDLLLIVNNALVFFTKNSSETNAAMEIRHLISKDISPKHAKSDSSSRKQVSLQSLSMPRKEESEASPSPSLMLKPRISGSLIICRKRSSITKATASSSATAKKKEHTPMLAEEDNKQQHSQPSIDADEPKITKKRTRERFPAASSANSKKNGKNQTSNNKISAAESVKQQGKGGPASSQQQPAEAKGDSKRSQSTSDAKKRGAANFLSRMKQGSSSNNGVLLDVLKNTPLTSEGTTSKGGSDHKKSENVKRGGKKEAAAATRRGTESRQTKEKVKEKSSPGKRNVGRPPKRGLGPPPPALGKRGRDRGETEPPAASKQPKKRSRKL